MSLYEALPRSGEAGKLALILDHGRIACWQVDALKAAGITRVALLLDCTNSAPAPRRLRHYAYYALNLVAIRNPLSRMVDFAETGIAVDETLRFAAGDDRGWQVLPPDVLEKLAQASPQAVVKFGMGLLRIPSKAALPAPILSYHHGDPRRFRGRPAGFWEYLDGGARLGQIVQALSNRLDAGAVLAYGETKIYRHSYRATMIEAYHHSALLLGPALARAGVAESALDVPGTGQNYRLPGTLAVLRFALRMGLAWGARVLRAATRRMAWETVLSPAPQGSPDRWTGAAIAAQGGTVLPPPPGSRFLADPFLSSDGATIWAESLSARSGKGEIVALDASGAVCAHLGDARHYSYPQPVPLPDGEAICPEIAGWSGPRLLRRDGAGLSAGTALDIAGAPRLVDPTILLHEGRWYLFGNSKALGTQALLLFTASDPHDRWVPHPASPIHISPRGGRMGGAILKDGLGALWRWGQDNSGAYGDSLVLYRIERIDAVSYVECEAGTLALTAHQGPHTINLAAGMMVHDRYRERFFAFAWVDRIKSRL